MKLSFVCVCVCFFCRVPDPGFVFLVMFDFRPYQRPFGDWFLFYLGLLSRSMFFWRPFKITFSWAFLALKGYVYDENMRNPKKPSAFCIFYQGGKSAGLQPNRSVAALSLRALRAHGHES